VARPTWCWTTSAGLVNRGPENSRPRSKCLILSVPAFSRFRSTRTGAEGRAGGEGAGAHAEARGERRGNVAEEIAATGAVALAAEGSGEIGAEPVTARIALRVDALHGEAGQVLHLFSLSSRKAQIDLVAID
jgi:hypothetical protein